MAADDDFARALLADVEAFEAKMQADFAASLKAAQDGAARHEALNKALEAQGPAAPAPEF